MTANTENSVDVFLSAPEIAQAGIVGMMRQIENLRAGRKHAHNYREGNDWQLHIEGALGEAALAKHLGVYWAGKGKLRAPDVGDVDVRTTSNHNNRLILHEEDPDDRQFWLLTGSMGRYKVRGYIFARDGKRPEYWVDPKGGRPAYFVPQSALIHPQYCEAGHAC